MKVERSSSPPQPESTSRTEADVLNGLSSAALNSFAQGDLVPLFNHLGSIPISVESELFGTTNFEAGVGEGSVATASGFSKSQRALAPQ